MFNGMECFEITFTAADQIDASGTNAEQRTILECRKNLRDNASWASIREKSVASRFAANSE